MATKKKSTSKKKSSPKKKQPEKKATATSQEPVPTDAVDERSVPTEPEQANVPQDEPTTLQADTQEPDEAVKPEATAQPAETPESKPIPQATPFVPSVRDPRLPSVGSVITRQYKGQTLEVTVLESGFEYNGQTYSSLSKLAKSITGHRAINGFAFFKLGVTGGKSTAAKLQAKILKVEKATARLRAALAEGGLALADAEKELEGMKEKAEQLAPKSE